MKRILLLLIAVFLTAVVFANPKYQVVDLGLTDQVRSIATSINDKGEVCGVYVPTKGGTYKLFYGSPSTGVVYPKVEAYLNLNPRPPLYYGVPSLYINNLGQVVGNCIKSPENPNLLCMWDNKNGLKHLDLGSDQGSIRIESFNDLGEIVYSKNGSIYIYKDGKQQNLGKLFEPKFGIKINNNSELFGTALASNGNLIARFHSLRTKRTYDMNTQPGVNYNQPGSNFYGISINDYSQGVIHWRYNEYQKTYLWTPTTGMSLIKGSLMPEKINNKGQMISRSCPCLFESEWNDLNVLLHSTDTSRAPFDSIATIYDINNKGQMVGAGYINRELHALLITPV